jgi:hypothetical protein
MDAYVLYLQSTTSFPSWTPWVRIPSPAPCFQWLTPPRSTSESLLNALIEAHGVRKLIKTRRYTTRVPAPCAGILFKNRVDNVVPSWSRSLANLEVWVCWPISDCFTRFTSDTESACTSPAEAPGLGADSTNRACNDEVVNLPGILQNGELGLSPVELQQLWVIHPADFHLIQIHGRLVRTPRWQQASGGTITR